MGKKAKKRVIKNLSAVTVTNISSLNFESPQKRPAMEQKQI